MEQVDLDHLRNILVDFQNENVNDIFCTFASSCIAALVSNLKFRFSQAQSKIDYILSHWEIVSDLFQEDLERLREARDSFFASILNKKNFEVVSMEVNILHERILTIDQKLEKTLQPDDVEIPIPPTIDIPMYISSFKLNPTIQGKHQIELLKKYIGRFHEIFSSESGYYAPFVPLIQSFGYGKSKVCFEILRECPGIPIVIRNWRSTSEYPLDKSWMQDFIHFVFNRTSNDIVLPVESVSKDLAKNYTAGRFLLALNTLISAYITWFNRLRRTMDTSAAIETIGNYFLSDMETWGDEDNKKLVFNESDNRSVLSAVLSLNDQLNKFVRINASFTIFKNEFGKMVRIDLPFLIVIDEIAEIEKSFRESKQVSAANIIKAGLHALSKETNLMVLAPGSNSEVIRFASIRKGKTSPLQYFERFNPLPPIVLSRNFDIFLEQARWPELDLSQAFLLNPEMFKLLVSMGRPLWSSRNISGIVAFSVLRIRNDDEGIIENAILATWLIRCSLEVDPSHLIARTLFNSHMATLYSVSTDGRSMKIKYPSEPILALGARSLLLQSESTIRVGRLKAFECLLDFIRQRAVENGRFTAVIFEQIVLFAMDDSPSATLLPPSEIACDNQILRNIFNARFCLSEVLRLDQPVQTQYHRFVEASYKVILIEKFLFKLYGIGNALIEECIAPQLRKSLVNSSHFVTLGRDTSNVFGKWVDDPSYGYDTMFLKKDVEVERLQSKQDQKQVFKLRRANTFTKDCDLIDRSLLKIGLMRQCGYVMPVNYYAIDYIIPYALEDQVQIGGRAGLGNSLPLPRNLYSFIPCRVKARSTSIHDSIVKMAVQFHYCKCYDHEKCSVETCPGLTTDHEMDLICENQLAFLFCGELEFPVSFGIEKVQYATKVISDEWNAIALTQINELFHKNQPVQILKIDYPSFSHCASLRDSGNSPDIIILKRLSSSVAVEIMRWFNGEGRPDYVLNCIISARLDSFTHLIGKGSVDAAYEIINYDSAVFDGIDDFNLPLTLDAIINSSHADFPDVDRQMTMARGRTPPFTDLPGTLRHCNNFELKKSIRAVDRRAFIMSVFGIVNAKTSSRVLRM